MSYKPVIELKDGRRLYEGVVKVLPLEGFPGNESKFAFFAGSTDEAGKVLSAMAVQEGIVKDLKLLHIALKPVIIWVKVEEDKE